MATLLIRNIDPELKDFIRDLAKQSCRSMSEEAKCLIRAGLGIGKRVGLGTRLFNLIDEKHRGDDLVFEIPTPAREAPDLE